MTRLENETTMTRLKFCPWVADATDVCDNEATVLWTQNTVPAATNSWWNT